MTAATAPGPASALSTLARTAIASLVMFATLVVVSSVWSAWLQPVVLPGNSAEN